MLISFHGKARSGKDTCADFLVKEAGFKKYSFADPIKQGVKAMFDWTDEHVYGDLKDVVDPFYGFSPRSVLQLVGTDLGRFMLREDIWLKVAEEFVSKNKHVVIPDVRFENEAAWVREQRGVVIHVERPVGKASILGVPEHMSEKGIDFNPKDILLTNDGSLEDLYKNLDGLRLLWLGL